MTRTAFPHYRLAWSAPTGPAPTAARAIPMDAVRTEGEVRLSFDLPGLASSDVEVTVERNLLTVSAERTEATTDGEKIISRERRSGQLSRQVVLSEELDGGAVSASMDNGVLRLTVPVAEKAKPQTVSVSDSAPVLEASTSDA